jgi:hypothetical protein
MDASNEELRDPMEGSRGQETRRTKALPIIKWAEAFRDYLHQMIGVRTIPLAYVIRPAIAVPVIGVISAGAPHSFEHEAIEIELIARASHAHPLYREDNSTVYYKLEEATRATSYAASITPFQRTKNGREAWLALTNQYAGKDKREAEIKRQEQLLHTRLWKGQSTFTLDRFIAQHRNAVVSMQAAAEHITYQLPNEHSLVGYLLHVIQSSDAGLQAAMASIKMDQDPDGLRNNFEAAATHLLPYDPVQRKRFDHAGGKRGAADISDVTHDEADISAFGAKKGIGKTGAYLRYYPSAEYQKLTNGQKHELREWRETTGGDKKRGKPYNKDGKQQRNVKFNSDKAIAAAVEKRVHERLKAEEKVKTQSDEAEAYIMSIFQKMSGKKATVAAAVNLPPAVAPPLPLTLHGVSSDGPRMPSQTDTSRRCKLLLPQDRKGRGTIM